MCLVPQDNVGDTQFGYRKTRSTEFGCVYLNDIISVFNESGSSVFVCGLNANKCFNSVWHDGLFYKLWSRISANRWIFIVTWYRSLRAKVNGITG